MSLDPFIALTAAMVNRAINDRDGEWVRDVYRDKPRLLALVEGFWANPKCRCGRPASWPTGRCWRCNKADKEMRRRAAERWRRCVAELEDSHE
jgi:hypothetical protein